MKLTSHRLTGTNMDAKDGETIIMLGIQCARLPNEDLMWQVTQALAAHGAWEVLAFEHDSVRYGPFCVRSTLIRWDM